MSLSASGSAQASQLYAPYGSLRYSQGTMPTDYGFTGQRNDVTSGLQYYGSRFYDPSAGQFVSVDTVLPGAGYDPLGLSRYAYVEGNPVARTDPSGHYMDDGSGGRAFLNPNTGVTTYDTPRNQIIRIPPTPGFTPSHHNQPTSTHSSSHVTINNNKPADTRRLLGDLIYFYRTVDPVADFFWLHPDLDPTGGWWLAHLYLEGFNPSDPRDLGLVAGMVTGDDIRLDSSGRLTNGTYTVNDAQMTSHMPATAGPGKSVFLSSVDAHKALLDAARFADEHALWDSANKAKVFVLNGPVGVLGKGGLLTSWINVYRRASGSIHGSPGTPP